MKSLHINPPLKGSKKKPTISVPFSVTLDRGEPEITKYRPLFGTYNYYQSEIKQIPLKARGEIQFYMMRGVHLDGGKFYELPLVGILWGWPEEPTLQTLVLYGTVRNLGCFCFNGYALMTIQIYDEQGNYFEVKTRVKTELK